jgi:predicted nucleic acid-binding protein
VIVIADTSPLNYLVLIGEIEVIPRLYQTVVIPAEVLNELRSPKTPAPVLAWSGNSPAWLQIQSTHQLNNETDIVVLGDGERAAISLALEHKKEALLLIDEGKGRRAAKRRQISIIGTLGVLDTAAQHGLLDLPEAVKKLQQTNFHVAPKLLGRLLEQDLERKRRRPK